MNVTNILTNEILRQEGPTPSEAKAEGSIDTKLSFDEARSKYASALTVAGIGAKYEELVKRANRTEEEEAELTRLKGCICEVLLREQAMV